MADATIHGIEFKIKGSSDAASDSVNKLTANLASLKTALSGISKVSNIKSAFGDLASGVEKVAVASSKITNEAIANLEKMVDALSKLSGVDLTGLGSAMNSVMRGGDKALTATPLSQEMRDMIASASQIDVLEAKLQSLRALTQAAFDKGDTDKAYGFRMQIIRTEAALQKAREAANGVSKSVENVGNAAKKSSGRLGAFLSSLKAFTRCFS